MLSNSIEFYFIPIHFQFFLNIKFELYSVLIPSQIWFKFIQFQFN